MIGAAANLGFLFTGLLSLALNQFLEGVTSTLHSLGLSEATADYLLHNRAWRFLAITGAAPALINFFILVFVPESHKWEQEKKSGSTSHWATSDLLGVFIATIAALWIIYVWSPTSSFHTGAAGVMTLIGLVVAFMGYIHPVRKYVARVAVSGTSHGQDHRQVFKHLLLGAGLAGVALLGTWGSTQQAPKVVIGPTGRRQQSTADRIRCDCHRDRRHRLDHHHAARGDKAGRRVTYTLLCLLSLITAVGFFQLNKPFETDEVPNSFFVSAFMLGAITASFYGFFPLYFPELFPTSVRATGQGFCFNFGR